MKLAVPFRLAIAGAAALASTLLTGAVSADIKIGMTVSSTGRFVYTSWLSYSGHRHHSRRRR